MKRYVDRKNAGVIKVKADHNPIELYQHQEEAVMTLDKAIVDSKVEEFAGLVVIPTGGGKTLTAVQWLLRTIINKNKKVLWLAHRHELLEQAITAVKKNANSDLINSRSEFNYRVISGKHDRPASIGREDDFIIAGKDSLSRGIKHLVENWLKYHDEVFLVVDEAHHATAKTYRKIIDAVAQRTKGLKMLGLTATPFRTLRAEKGLLKKVFTDGIVYDVELRTLISRGILSEPIFETVKTNVYMPNQLSEQDVKNIEAFDSIPPDIAVQIVKNKVRNNRIVQSYIDNKKEYGKTIVFAVNKIHAIELNKLFSKRGIASEYVISSDRRMKDCIDLSNEANSERVERFRKSEIEVLINVNILTEGTDIPDVQTIFLTRPTTSKVLMTQMVGRALRGEQAGGTKEAVIVSFIDDWRSEIAWVNPQELFNEECEFYENSAIGNAKKVGTSISVKMVEEFVGINDDSIDTSELEKVEFIKTIIAGVYSFSVVLLSDSGKKITKSCEVLVYDNAQEAYRKFVQEAPLMLKGLWGKDCLEEEELGFLSNVMRESHFSDLKMNQDYMIVDIQNMIRSFALNGSMPAYFDFKDREKFDILKVAQYIYENELGGKSKKEYIDELWEQDNSLFKLYFGSNKLYFRRSIESEIMKLEEIEVRSSPEKEVA